ncbi:MAG: MFS transporter [Myxococcales bacterium]|nr:MFS transporter [Myxococcales bacterium]
MAAPTNTDAPKTTLAEDLRALLRCPRELWLVYLATFFEYLGIFTFLQTLPLWLSSDFRFSDKQAGWWAATFSMLVSLFVFLVGSIADIAGVRRTLLVSFALAAVTRLAMSLASTPTAAIAALLAFGFAYATTSPVLQTAVQRASTKQTRAFAFSLWYVSFNVSGALSGPIIDGTRKYFLDPSTRQLVTKTIQLPLLGAKVMSANAAILGIGFLSATIAAIVVLFLRKNFEHRVEVEPDPKDVAFKDDADGYRDAPTATERAKEPRVEIEAPKPKPNPLQSLREVIAHKAFWRFMLMLALLCLVRMMFQHMHFTWPKYVIRERGEDFPVGTLWSVNSMLILVLAPLGTALTRKRKPFDVLLFGAFISSLSPFVLTLGSTMPYQVAMILLLTIGEALWSPRLYEYNISIAPRGKEATYVSLAALPYFLAKFLVGPTSGYLLSAYCPAQGPRNPAMLWAIIGLTTMLGPVGIFFLRDLIQKKDEPAETAEATAK